ncbi:MAG TPA: M20 family metallopeptidase [Vicinamibacterales bacterium]|nr:M20 family metallopeptidase [Vicinamibacterales bacterium]
MKALLQLCQDALPFTLDTIDTLVRLESPSTDKAAVDRCGQALAGMLRTLGGDVELLARADRGDHVRARVAGSGAPVLLLGHFDTVWPIGTIEQMPLRRDGDRLHGPGVFDMKAGIALGITAIRALRESGGPAPAVTMLWTTDEEIGSDSSRAEIEAEAMRSRAVLVLEPSLPGGALKTARKGCGEFRLTVHGIAAHAGLDPGKGASAIHELATQIAEIERLQDLPRGVSVNVGLVAGGTRPNVVAERAEATIDVRAPTRAAAEAAEVALRRLQPRRPGTRLTIEGGFERPPMERGPAVLELFSRASRVASSLGRELGEGSAGGGSDGNFTAALGVPTLDGLGAVGDGAHAAHEHVEISALPWRAALLAGLLADFARPS